MSYRFALSCSRLAIIGLALTFCPVARGQVEYCRYAQLGESELLAQPIKYDVTYLYRDTCSLLLATAVVQMYCATQNDELLGILDSIAQRAEGFLSEHMIDVTSTFLKCRSSESALKHLSKKSKLSGIGIYVRFFAENGKLDSEEFRVIQKFVSTPNCRLRRHGAFKALKSMVDSRMSPVPE
jgi:hypothetical protein